MLYRILKTQLKPLLFTVSGAVFAGVISDIIVRIATFDGYVDISTVIKFIFIYSFILLLSAFIALIAIRYPDEPIKHFSLAGKSKSKQIRIGIFNDIEWTEGNDVNHSWNNIKPDVWMKKYQQELKASRVSVEFVDVNSNFYDFDILLNPYGGVYKDFDLDKRPVLGSILDFVKTGGTFVNVSDTPFYYTFREELGYRVESRIQGIYLGHPFPGQITPLTNELNFYCTQHITDEVEERFTSDYDYLEQSSKPKIKMRRFAPINAGIKSIYEPYKYQNQEYSSLFFTVYGNGQFLISLLPFYLSDETDINSDYLARWMGLIVTLSTSKLPKHKNLT